MLRILPLLSRLDAPLLVSQLKNQKPVRTFLSQAYYCNELWDRRLSNPTLQNVNLDEMYYNLEQRFQKTRQLSAVDVNVYANAVTDEVFIDEMLDLVHKLRLTAETRNSLDSMSHAVVRVLLKYGKHEELLNVLDDRLNYGVFIDDYMGNILLDSFWKNKDFTSGARVASQFMLQEDFSHPLVADLSLLHCYNYLLTPGNWPSLPPPEEPEEEVRVRVKFLRNPSFDDHFDLKEPEKIVGKTLVSICKGKDDALNKSFTILGYALYGKHDEAKQIIQGCQAKNITVYKEVIDLIPDDNETKKDTTQLKTESGDVQNLLQEHVKKMAHQTSENDIAKQAEAFSRWEIVRQEATRKQQNQIDQSKRLEDIQKIKSNLKEKETKLWFFENEEQIELDIESKKKYYPKKWFGKKKKPRKVDEGYIPPEV